MISTDTGVQFIRSINTLGLPKFLQGFLMFDDFDQSVRLSTEFQQQMYFISKEDIGTLSVRKIRVLYQ
jgi:hypothetical protein